MSNVEPSTLENARGGFRVPYMHVTDEVMSDRPDHSRPAHSLVGDNANIGDLGNNPTVSLRADVGLSNPPKSVDVTRESPDPDVLLASEHKRTSLPTPAMGSNSARDGGGGRRDGDGDGDGDGGLVWSSLRRFSLGSRDSAGAGKNRASRRSSEWTIGADGRTSLSNYWSRVVTVSEGKEETTGSIWEATKIFAFLQWKSFVRTCRIAAAYPKILTVIVATFVVASAVGLAVVFVFANNYEKMARIEAVRVAEVMEQLIPSELNKALLPLYTLEAIVHQVDDFYDLPFETMEAPLFNTSTGRVFRNVSGICDDQKYIARYDELAASVKASAQMPGILVNVQLAPYGVVCLLYPLIDSEDFEDGIVMNNTGARGLELLNDPINGYYTRKAIQEDQITIQGPLTLVQGNVPVVKEALIARSPVYIKGHNIEISGKEYSFWGFTTVLLNWAKLKEKIGLYEYFESRGYEFLMTRTDILLNFTTNKEYTKVATIAKSNGSNILHKGNSVSVPLTTTDNEWELIVGCNCFGAPWKVGASVVVIILALLLSVAVMVLLVAKTEHESILYRLMPKEVVHRLHRGETVIEKYDLATVCFFDIVSFTAMSGQMEPVEVMSMLKMLFAVFDKLADKYQVCNVETIGDAYIVIGGGPERSHKREGAERVALFAYEAIEAVRGLEFENGMRVSIRAGLASGMVIAGVVGSTQPKFTIFGDTVTLASKMESTSETMRIQCSDATRRLLLNSQDFLFGVEKREGIGYHSLPTWWITGALERPRRSSFVTEHASANIASLQARDDNTKISGEGDVNSFVHGETLACNANRDFMLHGGEEEEKGPIQDSDVSENDVIRVDQESALKSIDGAREPHIFFSSPWHRGCCRALFRRRFPRGSGTMGNLSPDRHDVTRAPRVNATVHEAPDCFSYSVNAPEEDDDIIEPDSRRTVKRPSHVKTHGVVRKTSLVPAKLPEEDGYSSEEAGGNDIIAGEKLIIESDESSCGNDDDVDEKVSFSCYAAKASDPALEELSSFVISNKESSEISDSSSNGDALSGSDVELDDIESNQEDVSGASIESSGSADEGECEVASIYSKESAAFHTYWTRLAGENDAWGDDFDDPSIATTCVHQFCLMVLSKCRSLKRVLKTAFKHRKIAVVSLVAFAILCTAGLSVVIVFVDAAEERFISDVQRVALDADRKISNEFYKTSLPLFALAELVQVLNSFDGLPEKVLNASIISYESGRIVRNVSGVCDDESYTVPFRKIASSVEENAYLPGALTSIKLMPSGIECLFYPSRNTGFTNEGNRLESTSVIGNDVVHDPYSGFYAKKAIKERRTTIQGPSMPTKESEDAADQLIIAKHPIFTDRNNFSVDNETYPFWGFSAVDLNWKELENGGRFSELLSEKGLEYVLTITDIVLNATTNSKMTKIHTVTQSEGSGTLNDSNSITLALKVTGDNWALTVGVGSNIGPTRKAWGSACVLVGSLLISFALMIVLVATKEHELLLYRMMPKEAIRPLQRGETVIDTKAQATIFFSHFIGFSTISGHMKPKEFMVMLNQIYGEFDKLVAKHQVHKVETIGDAYIVTGGENGAKGAERAALFALDAVLVVIHFRYKEMRLFIRAGLASGPVVSGVVGAALPKYTIFGDTVNFASRMESTSKSMKIQCSNVTKQLLEESPLYHFELKKRHDGGEEGIFLKGKGYVRTWWIVGARRQRAMVSTENPSASNKALQLSMLEMGDRTEKCKVVTDAADESDNVGTDTQRHVEQVSCSR